jgi:hypothetical protein
LQCIEDYSDEKENSMDLLINTHHLVKWAREIANGMDYLGSKKVTHWSRTVYASMITSFLINSVILATDNTRGLGFKKCILIKGYGCKNWRLWAFQTVDGVLNIREKS